MNEDAFVVEQDVGCINENGVEVPGSGTARVYVGTEARAKEIVHDGLTAKPPKLRSYRRVPLAEMPEQARLNLLRARAEAAL